MMIINLLLILNIVIAGGYFHLLDRVDELEQRLHEIEGDIV